MEDVCEHLGCRENFVRKCVRSRGLPVAMLSSGLIRFRPSDVEEWVSQQTRVLGEYEEVHDG